MDNFLSFKVKNYKCFLDKNDFQGFDEIKPINVIIGKNNSGKSKILEFLKDTIEGNQNKPTISRAKDSSKLAITYELTQNMLQPLFPTHISGGELSHLAGSHKNHWNGIGEKLVGKKFTHAEGACEIHEHEFETNSPHKEKAFTAVQKKLLDRPFPNFFQNHECLVIQAERNIKHENVNFNSEPSGRVSPDGQQLTDLIVRCLNEEKGHKEGWQNLIEVKLLNAINDVLFPDIKFSRISAKVNRNQSWELYLEEEKKGGIRLSDCGSGIKTVILTMTMLYVVPEFRKTKNIIYMFEELENNLHPALERKLLVHIRDHIKKTPEHTLFLTTHSNIAIDIFSKDDQSQILRAYNDNEGSHIQKVEGWSDINNTLDDIGIKASDILQSNCIIWMEGPSDRIYFKKWIELFSALLEEGIHYQCLFYGGANLSHHTATEADENDGLIKMLRINRNSIILMDSDLSNADSNLKPRVERVREECNNNGRSLAWITDGREIENYIPSTITKELIKSANQCDKYTKISEEIQKEKGKKTFDKVTFARDVIKNENYTKENLENTLDLKDRINEVIQYIKKCNG